MVRCKQYSLILWDTLNVFTHLHTNKRNTVKSQSTGNYFCTVTGLANFTALVLAFKI